MDPNDIIEGYLINGKLYDIPMIDHILGEPQCF